MTIKRVTRNMNLGRALNYQDWNSMVDAAEENRRGLDFARDERADWEWEPATYLRIKNDTAERFEAHQPVVLTDPTNPVTDNAMPYRAQNVVMKAVKPSGGALGNWVLPWQSVNPGAIGWAYAGGVVATKVELPANASWLKWCDVESDKTTLYGNPAGAGRILWIEDTTAGVHNAMVRIGRLQYRELPVKTTEEIQVDVGGGVEVYQLGSNTNFPMTAMLDWMHSDLNISQGKEALIGYYPHENIWRFVGAECEDSEPLLGNMYLDAPGATQAVSANTPVAISAFNTSAETPNLTPNFANASYTLPANDTEELYETAVSFGLLVPSNNTVVQFHLYVNGVLEQTIGAVSAQNAANSQAFSVTRLGVRPAGPAEELALWVESDKGGTITWSQCNYSIKRMT